MASRSILSFGRRLSASTSANATPLVLHRSTLQTRLMMSGAAAARAASSSSSTSSSTSSTALRRAAWPVGSPARCYPNATAVFPFRAMSVQTFHPKAVEPVADIERDLHSLFSAEIDRLEAQQLEFNALKETLARTGFVLKEREGKAILTRRFEDRNITLTWDPSIEVAAHDHLDPDALGEDQEDESADQQADGNNEGDANDEEGEYDEGAADEKVAGDLEIEVRVEAQNKTLVAHCAVAEDCLLYVYQLTLPSSDRTVSLERVSTSLQHRVYDYLESLGVGDSIALFIRKYNQLYRVNAELQGISTVNSFFKGLGSRPKST